jgi:DNA invertase Pin-like site-specific DNA recombinase
MRAAIYLRVSTDCRTTEDQRLVLEGIAAHRGWIVVGQFEDADLSGRSRRPGLDALLKAATQGQFDVLMCWAIDCVGRSLTDLLKTMSELHAARVDIFLHQQAIDTTTPAGRAMFQMTGVFAEFERALISARIRAGLERARAAGRSFGRPKVDEVTTAVIARLLADGMGINRVARQTGVGTATVQRIRAQMEAQEYASRDAGTMG